MRVYDEKMDDDDRQTTISDSKVPAALVKAEANLLLDAKYRVF